MLILLSNALALLRIPPNVLFIYDTRAVSECFQFHLDTVSDIMTKAYSTERRFICMGFYFCVWHSLAR